MRSAGIPACWAVNVVLAILELLHSNEPRVENDEGEDADEDDDCGGRPPPKQLKINELLSGIDRDSHCLGRELLHDVDHVEDPERIERAKNQGHKERGFEQRQSDLKELLEL